MQWFRDLKVGAKVFICCFVFLLIISGIAIQSYSNSLTSDAMVTSFYNDKFEPVRWVNRAARNILQRRINMVMASDAFSKKDFTEVSKRLADSEKLGLENAELWKKYSALKKDPKEQALADDFNAANMDLKAVYESYVSAIKSNNLASADKYEMEWLSVFRSVRDKLDLIIQYKDELAQKTMAEQKENHKRVVTILVIAWILSIGIGVLITILLASSVSNPVKKGLAFADKISQGDFRERIDLEQKDELGVLGKALNRTADNLENMISEVMSSTQNLIQAVDQISVGNQNLSQRTTEQASALEEVAATIEEANASINMNYENSLAANKRSDESFSLAKDGGILVQDAVSSINQINMSAKKIEEITAVINDIAFQTNLLALNAAVEAARAGEQGRGFAVVAGEVRNLAQRAGSAAKEIAALIKDTVFKVDEGTEKANKSGSALTEIIESVKNVGISVGEITAASNEQKQGMGQINTAITELDKMTQQNAALVEETAAASEEMASQAQELFSMMKRFKVRNENADTSKVKHQIHLRAAEMKRETTAPVAAAAAVKQEVKETKMEPVILKEKEKAEIKHFEAAKPKIAPLKKDDDKTTIEKILSNEGFQEF